MFLEGLAPPQAGQVTGGGWRAPGENRSVGLPKTRVLNRVDEDMVSDPAGAQI